MLNAPCDSGIEHHIAHVFRPLWPTSRDAGDSEFCNTLSAKVMEPIMDFLFLPFIFIPVIVVFVFVFAIAKGLAEWSHNNSQPVLTRNAKIVAKRSAVQGGVEGGRGNVQTAYFATFQLESGERLEFQIAGEVYGLLSEGDSGTLTHQGTRYKGFQRSI
jgi:hypothetical protein